MRANVCLTATTTALFVGGACGQATASETHTLKHGQTVDFLAHHYHVGVKAILAANHLSADDILRDGRSLYIPDAPRPLNVPHTMRRSARITGDRISVRIGPASSHHRLRLCDDGTRLVVTAEQDGWLQVTLPDGHTGWVRTDFVRFHGGQPSADLARSAPGRRRRSDGPAPQVVTTVGRERTRALRALSARAERIARKHHEEHHPLQEASARLQSRSGESSAMRLHLHVASASRARHERHLAEAAEARRHAVRVSAHHRHAEELASERAHHKHLAAIAQARHHKHLAEIAQVRHHKHVVELARAESHRNHHADGHAHRLAEQARHARRLAEIAENRRQHHLHAVASAHHKHHDAELAHERRLRHLEEAAAAQHRHHIAALNNARHRHLLALARHHHNAEVAAARHSSGHYSHRIRPEAESPSASNDVVRSAFAYRGTPYRWGESRPGGFDCSGFTKYVYGRKGVALPRTAAEQYHAGRAVGHRSMKPGDLVFFHTTRSGISHVGMYVGNGKFVHSSSKKNGGVRVDNLDSGYYSKAFRGARRVRPETNEPSGE
jgi:cell wall-associated NlpC family hydrolase/LysM repeat protein